MELVSQYILKSKNIPLLWFSQYKTLQKSCGEQDEVYVLKIDQINENHIHLLPFSLRKSLTPTNLSKWINRRKAPKNRRFVNKLLYAVSDNTNPMAYVDVSHALSLNDALWITNQIYDLKWEDFNLYHHPFDEILSQIAFTGYSHKVSGVVTSPELTSSGMLKKCWLNRNGKICLIKGDDVFKRSDERSQATMEYYAAQIAQVMHFDHVPYNLELFTHRDGTQELVCSCELFTSEDVGFVNAYTFLADKGFDLESDFSQVATHRKIANLFGKSQYEDLMVFDAIICNQDRHLSNFGVLVDNNTGEYIKPAPIFDNGASLLFGAANSDLQDVNEYILSIQGKHMDFDVQGKAFVQQRHSKYLRKLLNFSFKKHPQYNISDVALTALNKLIQIRAKKILQYCAQKEQSTNSSLAR